MTMHHKVVQMSAPLQASLQVVYKCIFDLFIIKQSTGSFCNCINKSNELKQVNEKMGIKKDCILGHFLMRKH